MSRLGSDPNLDIGRKGPTRSEGGSLACSTVPAFQNSPGMRDILPDDTGRWRRLNSVFADIVGAAGYGQIITPLIEDVGVFTRIGEATDVVSKELYAFEDRGGRHVSLRPELTAGVCRAFAQHRPAALPWKVWYSGPNFRQEKAQRGRYRQFDQVGVEVLGVDDAHLDVEVIALASEFYARLGLKQVRLILNSLGEPEDRVAYVTALEEYFEHAELSDQSRATLAKNPLRVPRFEARTRCRCDRRRTQDLRVPLARCCGALRHGAGGPDPTRHRLRRGTQARARARLLPPHDLRVPGWHARLGTERTRWGGRYDGLVEALGGPATPGIGFALGVDRTLLACDDEGVFDGRADPLDVFVVDVVGGQEAAAITTELRRTRLFSADRAFDDRSMKAQMKLANRSGAAVAVIIGERERTDATVIVRPMARAMPATNRRSRDLTSSDTSTTSDARHTWPRPTTTPSNPDPTHTHETIDR